MASHRKQYIALNLYKKILQSIPICCVDIVPVYKNQFLLIKRIGNTAQNKWWIPGGRIFLNENPTLAAKRKLKEELGLINIKKFKFLGVGENRFRKGRFKVPSHTINIVFLVELDQKNIKDIKLDYQSTKYKLVKPIEKSLHPYIKKCLRLGKEFIAKKTNEEKQLF